MNAAHAAISEVAVTASLQRRIFLFGSFTQFLSYFLWMALVFLGCRYFMGAEVPRALFIITLSGAFLGSLPSLWLALPARFFINAAGSTANAWLRDLDVRLQHFGYGRAEGDAIRYEPNLARWLRWSEQSIEITCQDGRIDVTGPIGVIRRLRRNLAEARA